MQKQHVLITGGGGLLGKQLTNQLLEKGFSVSHLSRGKGKDPRVTTFLWDIDKGEIDDLCIDGVDTIIHLAGAGIVDKRWTESRKKELIDSRTKSINLIYELLKKRPTQVKNVISASATGYYSNRGDELLTEDSAPGHDFLAECCILWEQAVDKGKELGLRVVKFRTGVVLSIDGGALPPLAQPIKMGFGAALGNGKQWVPWIHWQDVADLYMWAIEDKSIQGVYNMVAPHPVTNSQLTVAVAKQLKKPLWLPNIPAWFLRILLGQMSLVVLGSSKVSAAKLEKSSYKFKYPEIAQALTELYG